MEENEPKLSLAARYVKSSLRSPLATIPRAMIYPAIFTLILGIIAITLGVLDHSNSTFMMGLLILSLGSSQFERAGFYELLQNEKNSNQRVDPTVKTPVESGNEQGTAGHP